MNSGRMSINSSSDLEQIQPIYLAQAQVFIFDPEETKQWVPLGEIVVPISILYDATRGIYRIISVDAECQKVIVNSTILPDLEFHKTSQKFGHWTDQSTGTIYGIGFASEYEHDSFFDCLKKVRAAVIGLLKEPSYTDSNAPGTTYNNRSGREVNNPQITQQHKGQGEGLVDSYQTNVASSRCILPSWTNYEHLGLNLAGLLDQANKTHAELPPPPTNRQSTFRVSDSPLTSPRIEDLKVKPPMYKPPMQFLLGQNGGPQKSARRNELSLDNSSRDTVNHKNSRSHNQMTDFAADDPNSELIQEIHRLKTENLKLKDALIESSSNVKKWEVQLDSLRSDNAELVKTMNDMTLKIEELKKESCEYKEQCHRWKDHATNSATKFQNAKELEEKVRQLAGDKSRLETKVKELEDNVRKTRFQQLNGSSTGSFASAASSGQMVSSKRAEEMEDYYRKLLSDTQKQLDEALAANRDGNIAVHRVDGKFCKTIHDLIAIHDQLRQAINQNKNQNAIGNTNQNQNQS